MEILTSITEDETVESFLSIVRYGLKYFNLTGIGEFTTLGLRSLASNMTTPMESSLTLY